LLLGRSQSSRTSKYAPVARTQLANERVAHLALLATLFNTLLEGPGQDTLALTICVHANMFMNA